MEDVVVLAGLFVPFAAFAGGLRVHRMAGPGSVLARALLLASAVVGIGSALYRLRRGFKPRRSHRNETPTASG